MTEKTLEELVTPLRQQLARKEAEIDSLNLMLQAKTEGANATKLDEDSIRLRLRSLTEENERLNCEVALAAHAAVEAEGSALRALAETDLSESPTCHLRRLDDGTPIAGALDEDRIERRHLPPTRCSCGHGEWVSFRLGRKRRGYDSIAWECAKCGRLFVDGHDLALGSEKDLAAHRYAKENEENERELEALTVAWLPWSHDEHEMALADARFVFGDGWHHEDKSTLDIRREILLFCEPRVAAGLLDLDEHTTVRLSEKALIRYLREQLTKRSANTSESLRQLALDHLAHLLRNGAPEETKTNVAERVLRAMESR